MKNPTQSDEIREAAVRPVLHEGNWDGVPRSFSQRKGTVERAVVCMVSLLLGNLGAFCNGGEGVGDRIGSDTCVWCYHVLRVASQSS